MIKGLINIDIIKEEKNNKIYYLPIKYKEKNEQIKLKKLVKVREELVENKVFNRQNNNRFNILSELEGKNKSKEEEMNKVRSINIKTYELKELLYMYLENL